MLALLRARSKDQNAQVAQEENVTFSFLFVCCHGGGETLRSTRRKGEKVIINHIYDAVREPT